MTNQPFRFIHAADLHLELPVNGLTECPEHLEEKILEAQFGAARRLFQYAVREKVDFIVLSGDVIAPHLTGPWGLLFLIDEFKKLQTEGIQVYWAGGKADSPDEIPPGFLFPPNVHFFPVGKMEEFQYLRGDVPAARLIGTSLGKQAVSLRPTELEYDPEGVYTIAVFYGKVSPESVRGDGVQYWALGGEHRRDFLSRSPSIIHYPGVTLARSPREVGDYGASLVEVNEFGQTKVNFIKLSPVRWVTERIVAKEDVTEEEILTEMRGRLKNLRDGLGDVLLFVSWRIDTVGNLVQELRYGNMAGAMLRDLRADYGKEEPLCWSVDVKPLLPDVHDTELYNQQTILGDYLRMVHFYQENPDEKLDLTTFFSDELKEYLQVRRIYDQRRREQPHRENGDPASAAVVTPSEESAVSDADIRAFRAEVPVLVDLLLDEDHSTALEEYRDLSENDEERRKKDRLALRTAALREAAMLGTELLSGDDSVAARKTVGPRQNNVLSQERRSLSQLKEGKESLS